MRKLWNELTKDERTRLITIAMYIVAASLASWAVTMFFVPEFNGIFIPISEWKYVLKSKGYWDAYATNTAILGILTITSWFTMTKTWRREVKEFVLDYVIDCAKYFRR